MLLLILDFDNTLGDTYGPFGEGNIFRTKTLPDIEEATKIYEALRRGPDNILAYHALLEAYHITDPRKFLTDAWMGKQLYDDVVPFLQKVQQMDGLKSVILTAGDEEYQRLKLEITGVDTMVNKVYTTRIRDKRTNIRSIVAEYQPSHTIFVDDRLNWLTSAEFDFPITILEMDRSGTKQGPWVIHALSEIPLTEVV